MEKVEDNKSVGLPQQQQRSTCDNRVACARSGVETFTHVNMKSVTPSATTPVPIKTEILPENEVEKSLKYFLDTFRSTYIAERSGELLQDHDPLDQLQQINQERQEIVEELVEKFSLLSEEEKLLFFLRIPVFTQKTTTFPKLGIFTTRTEIRRTVAWIRSHLEEDIEAAIPKRDVYDKYLEHCQSSRMIPISIADFGKVMKHMYPSVRPRRLGMRGKSQYCYAGMGSCKHVKRPSIYPAVNIDSDATDSRRLQGKDDCYDKTEQCKSDAIESWQAREESKVEYQTTSIYGVANEEIVAKCARNCLEQEQVETNKARKAAPCQKGRRKFSHAKSLKDLSLASNEPAADVQLEDEVAQYFRTSDFRRPLKLVKGSSTRCSAENRFYSSREIPSVERCQSSVEGCWPNYDSPIFKRSNSHNESVTPHRSLSRMATEQLANLQLTSISNLSRGSSIESSQQGCGFTPISPSPVPLPVSVVWTSFNTDTPQSQLFVEQSSEVDIFRPRGYSLNESKSNLKRDFECAFDKLEMQPGENAKDPVWIDGSTLENATCYQLNEKQPLEIAERSFPHNTTEIDAEMTCQELNEILANTMAVESINFDETRISQELLPESEGILPQLENIFSHIKPATDINDIGVKIPREDFLIQEQASLDDQIIGTVPMIAPSMNDYRTDFPHYF